MSELKCGSGGLESLCNMQNDLNNKKPVMSEDKRVFDMTYWCREPESNRHALRRGILSPVRLPIPPSRQRKLSIMLDLPDLSKTHDT